MNNTAKSEKSQPTTTNHQAEWETSAIPQSLIDLNLRTLEQDEIGDWYFENLPQTARRNDGRIRTGYLTAYDNPLQGGWGAVGYDPTDLDAEPELRCFKPDIPRTGKDGKPIKYDFPKNGTHKPIFSRVDYLSAALIFRRAGLNFLKLLEVYEPKENIETIDQNTECSWFWQAVKENIKIPISITEGAKKNAALIAKGVCSIAVTSITTWRAEKGSDNLHPWLALFAPKRDVYIVFDQDAKKTTIKAVKRQIMSLGKAFIKAGGSRVKRISWSGTAKGVDDFLAKVQEKYGVDTAQKLLDKSYENACDYRFSKDSDKFPGVIKKINEPYLSLDKIPEAAKAKIFAIKSAKATNKTGVISELILSDRHEGIPTLNISYLSKLGLELSDRFDIPYRTDKDTTLLRNSIGYSLCLDSFSPNNSVPLRAKEWNDAGVVIDEVTQVFHHLAFGSTDIKKNRTKVAFQLAQKAWDCWQNDKPFRVADADLTPESVQFIQDYIILMSNGTVSREQVEAETLVLINEYQPPKGNLHFYNEPKPKAIMAELREKMEKGENLLLLSSSQKSSSKKGTKNLEKFARKFYEDSEILRIDSQTGKNPNHPAFGLTAEELIKLLKNQTYKVVIGSPSICTGIDLSGLDGFFAAVFSFQSGNLPLNSIRQQLSRLRDFKAPRHVWCHKNGINYIGCKSTNPVELLADEKNQAKFTFSFLGIPQAEKLLESNICPLTKLWANLAAKKNFDNYHYREILLADLEAEGWNIIVENPDPDSKKLKEAWKECEEIQQQSKREENQSVKDAPELTKKEAKKIDSSPTQTNEQVFALKKHNLKKKYSVDDIDIPLIEADQKKLYPGLKLRFWLTVGRQYLEDHDRNSIEKHRENNDGNFFIPDINKSINILKVKALEVLAPYLSKVYKPGSEWNNKSPELKKLRKFALEHLIHINQILKCGIVKSDSPITVIQKILRTIGLKLPYLRNERDGKKRLRIYGAAVSRFGALHHLEDEIFSGWLKREKKAASRLCDSLLSMPEGSISSGAA